MKQAVEDLKERPKNERTAVAGGIAALVALLLLLGWGLIFFKNITRGGAAQTQFGPRTDVVDFGDLNEARASFSDSYFDATEELRRIRDDAAAAQRAQIESEAVSDDTEARFDTSVLAPPPPPDAFGL